MRYPLNKGGIMKHILLLGVVCAIFFSETALAVPTDHEDIGVGVILGIPTGLSGKFWFSDRSAIDAAVGWNFETQYFAFQAGYLYNFPLDVPSGFLAAYVGAGGLLELASPSDERVIDPLYVSGRIPIGLEYIYQPVGFCAELDPLLVLYPGIGFEFGGGIGFRFYF
jgi:hypothetical protein